MSEEYEKAQLALHVKEGERVLIQRKAKDYENGWGNSWCMDRYIETIGTVVRDVGNSGVRVKHSDGTKWNYPYFVLAFIDRIHIT